ncbi:guanylate kinase [Stylonychia lemnae]|uniref:Guanylate kinase n=1 Tax=Stylonychia lemnae TaxID=5949 RepID=A0A077ZZ56_STYLE|nr:guanylate kinase [Stylonychia lemnae]|eukprot:CDW75210.1 guanylate kinase [Stylonychia lemnae]
MASQTDQDLPHRDDFDNSNPLYQTTNADGSNDAAYIQDTPQKGHRSNSHGVDGSTAELAFRATASSSFLFQSKLNPFTATLSSTQHVDRMINAKFDKHTKKQQLGQLEARIKKLEVEESKARRRIEEARRQQDFIKNMKTTKAQRVQQKQEFLEFLKKAEEDTRMKINETRQRQRSMINQNFTSVLNQNHMSGVEIKEQKKRIKEMIDHNKHQYLQEREQAFCNHKNNIRQSIMNRSSQQHQTLNSNQKFYESKIQNQQKDAEELERKLKEMEQHEQMMIQRLQNTYKREKSTLQKLDEVKSISVPKPSLRFDNYQYVNPRQVEADAQAKADEYMSHFDMNQDGFISYTELMASQFFESHGEAKSYAETFFANAGVKQDQLETARVTRDQLKKCIFDIVLNELRQQSKELQQEQHQQNGQPKKQL